MVIYGDIVVNFLRILSTKSTISQKLKIAEIGKCFLIGFRTLRIFWDQKILTDFCDILGNFLSILSAKPTISACR